MPTVIDSLVVTLGLDGAAYTKAIDTAVSGRDKVAKADTAGGKATVDAEKKRKDAIAATTKVATEGYRAMAGQLLGVLGILGTIGAGGLLGKLASTNVQLDTNAKLLGMSTQQLYAWKKAADALGGSGDDLQQSLAGINAELNGLAAGQGLGSKLQAVNKLMSFAHMPALNFKGMTAAQVLEKVREADARVSPRVAQQLNGEINISGANTLAMANPNWDRDVARYRADAPSEGAIEQSRQLKEMLGQIDAAFENLENTVLADLGPDINKALAAATDWWAKNGQQFTKDFEAFLKTAVTDAESFGKEVNSVVTALGGWKSVSEDLFALWVGGKFLGMLGNVIKLVRLFRALKAGVPGAEGAGGAGAAGAAEAGAAEVGAGAASEGALTLGAGALGAAVFPAVVAGAALYAGQKIFATGDTRLPQSTVDTANPLYQQLIQAGVSPQGAAAILGNAMAESSLDPTQVDSTNHAGLFQWSTARRAQIKMQFGKDPLQMTRAEQITAFLWEAKNNPAYAATNKAIFDPGGSTGETAETINRNFEGSADYSGKRAAYANGFYNRFAGGATAGRVPTLRTQDQAIARGPGGHGPSGHGGVSITNHNTIVAPSTDAKSITQKLTDQHQRDVAMANQYGPS
jgi:hypothetical protein